MGIFKAKAVTSMARTGFSLKKFLYYRFLFLFLAIIVVIAIVQGVKAGSPLPTIMILGDNIVGPTLTLEEKSMEIIESGEMIEFSEGYFSGIWDAFIRYWTLFSSLFFIGSWIFLFSWCMRILPYSGDNSRILQNFSLGITLFFIIQIAYFNTMTYLGVADYTWLESLKTPFLAFWTFFQAIFTLLSSSTAEGVSAYGESIVNTTFNNGTG